MMIFTFSEWKRPTTAKKIQCPPKKTPPSLEEGNNFPHEIYLFFSITNCLWMIQTKVNIEIFKYIFLGCNWWFTRSLKTDVWRKEICFCELNHTWMYVKFYLLYFSISLWQEWDINIIFQTGKRKCCISCCRHYIAPMWPGNQVSSILLFIWLNLI